MIFPFKLLPAFHYSGRGQHRETPARPRIGWGDAVKLPLLRRG